MTFMLTIIMIIIIIVVRLVIQIDIGNRLRLCWIGVLRSIRSRVVVTVTILTVILTILTVIVTNHH